MRENKRDILCCGFSMLTYCINSCFLKKRCTGVWGFFLKCYLNDLVAPIFVLALSGIILRRIGYELKKFWIIMAIGISAALAWEFVIPLMKSSSVTDLCDLLCYVAGTVVYYLIRKSEKNLAIEKKTRQ